MRPEAVRPSSSRRLRAVVRSMDMVPSRADGGSEGLKHQLQRRPPCARCESRRRGQNGPGRRSDDGGGVGCGCGCRRGRRGSAGRGALLWTLVQAAQPVDEPGSGTPSCSIPSGLAGRTATRWRCPSARLTHGWRVRRSWSPLPATSYCRGGGHRPSRAVMLGGMEAKPINAPDAAAAAGGYAQAVEVTGQGSRMRSLELNQTDRC